jgi:hypothetical protein
MNRSLPLADGNLTSSNSRQTGGVNEGDEINPRKIRTGMMIVGGMTAVAIALLIVISDTTARFVFGFVAIVGLVQTWRIRRRWRSLQ